MEQNDAYYKKLLIGYINNSISANEVRVLYAFMQREPEKYALMMDEPDIVYRATQQAEIQAAATPELVDQRFAIRIKTLVEQQVPGADKKRGALAPMMPYWRWVAVAVMVMIATGVVVISLNNHKQQPAATVDQMPARPDAKPGRNGAILTLANGTKIQLDSLSNGVITTQGNTTVLLKNDQLVYDAAAEQKETLYNTMTTPRGRLYQLLLPDGSKVWLNAASSITYPIAFNGKDRRVAITGEAYFEIEKDPSRPFYVTVNEMEVKVLGTHFDVNSYADEDQVRTTLLEGSVSISNKGHASVLKPGQQAVIEEDNIRVVNQADIELAMAWKNGRFQFNNTPLPIVLKHLSRWYDIEVEYVKDTPDVVFAGKIGRDLNLSQVLKVLSKMEVNFKIEGNKLKVIH